MAMSKCLLLTLRDNIKIQIKLLSTQQQNIIKRDETYGGHHFKPLPVVLEKGNGVYLWDIDGKRYIDFLAGFATCNQGHCHPRLVKVMQNQCNKLHHTSRAYFNSLHGELAEYITRLLNFDRFIPMNTGVEGGDLALKLARHWGYKIKKIPNNKAKILFANSNFWGRSLAAISASTEPLSYTDFGPFMPNFIKIPYDNLDILEEEFKNNPDICAFMVEPIQGEAGVKIPKDGYLNGVRKLCTKYNVLWIADEVQTGLGRTGYRLAVDYENEKPDILILGKALSGGMYPVSGVLSSNEIIENLKAGTHGSTFGGSPLACSIALESLRIIEEEKLSENSKKLGKIVKEELEKIPKNIASEYRGRGLLAGLLINKEFANGWDICLKLRDAGLLTRPAHGQLIRISPPLVINEQELRQGLDIIKTTLLNY